ncbi:hypothetical protein ACOSQ4_026446 [Xanthoceras sorbifolium]
MSTRRWYEGRLRKSVRSGEQAERDEQARSRYAERNAEKAKRRKIRRSVIGDLCAGFEEESKTAEQSRDVKNRGRNGNGKRDVQGRVSVIVIVPEENREERDVKELNGEENRGTGGFRALCTGGFDGESKRGGSMSTMVVENQGVKKRGEKGNEKQGTQVDVSVIVSEENREKQEVKPELSAVQKQVTQDVSGVCTGGGFYGESKADGLVPTMKVVENQCVNNNGENGNEKQYTREVSVIVTHEENQDQPADTKELISQDVSDLVDESKTGRPMSSTMVVENRDVKQDTQGVISCVTVTDDENQDKQDFVKELDDEIKEKLAAIESMLDEDSQDYQDVDLLLADDSKFRLDVSDYFIEEILDSTTQDVKEIGDDQKNQDKRDHVMEIYDLENQHNQAVKEVGGQENMVIEVEEEGKVDKEKKVESDQTPEVPAVTGDPSIFEMKGSSNWPENGWYVGIDDWPLVWTYEEEKLWGINGLGLGSVSNPKPNLEYISGIGWVEKSYFP